MVLGSTSERKLMESKYPRFASRPGQSLKTYSYYLYRYYLFFVYTLKSMYRDALKQNNRKTNFSIVKKLQFFARLNGVAFFAVRWMISIFLVRYN